MATLEAAHAPLQDRLRDYAGRMGDFLAGPGLWLVIAGFVAWAAVAERDAFVIGIVSGSIFALGAIGLTLIYGILKFGHFAHGDSMMLAAYLAFFFLSGTILGSQAGQDTRALPVSVSDLPAATDTIWKFSFGYGLIVAMALAAIVTVLVFVGLDSVLYRLLRRRKSGIVIFSIASLGVAIAMRSMMLMFWGPNPRLYSAGIRERVHLPFGVAVLADQLFIFAAAIVMTVLIYLLLFRTKLGKAMRAMADNADLARISGINTDRVILWTWVVAGGLVAVAGVFLALQAQLNPELGFVLLLPLFAAAILGGIGNPQGAFVGGMIVGITQEVAVTFSFLSPGYKFSIAFVILIVILLVRPRGLFGART